MSDAREEAAERFRTAGEELKAAAAHCEIAANHFRSGEVPRGCAHAFAAEGHAAKARNLIQENAIVHSSKAQV